MQNSSLRKNVISRINPDIVCIQETHLENRGDINCENYKWFGFNRTLNKKNSRKGSGGIDTLVKEDILHLYNIEVVAKRIDGILGLKFIYKLCPFSFVLHCCYLPPEGSCMLTRTISTLN